MCYSCAHVDNFVFEQLRGFPSKDFQQLQQYEIIQDVSHFMYRLSFSDRTKMLLICLMNDAIGVCLVQTVWTLIALFVTYKTVIFEVIELCGTRKTKLCTVGLRDGRYSTGTTCCDNTTAGHFPHATCCAHGEHYVEVVVSEAGVCHVHHSCKCAQRLFDSMRGF